MKWSEMLTLILLPTTQERMRRTSRLPELPKCAKLLWYVRKKERLFLNNWPSSLAASLMNHFLGQSMESWKTMEQRKPCRLRSSLRRGSPENQTLFPTVHAHLGASSCSPNVHYSNVDTQHATLWGPNLTKQVQTGSVDLLMTHLITA